MTWTNAFDLGTCTINVVDYGNDPLRTIWSGVLGIGQSAAISDMGTNAQHASGTIAVDSTGTVTLTADLDSLSLPGGFQVEVVPSYAHDYDAQITGASSQLTNYKIALGCINDVDDEGVGYLQWEGANTSPPSVPDPADLSSLTGERDLIGFFVESSGT